MRAKVIHEQVVRIVHEEVQRVEHVSIIFQDWDLQGLLYDRLDFVLCLLFIMNKLN